MERKGQAAMEFLMTYGWAILAAIIAIGVLASFGVFTPGKYAPSGTVLNPPFQALGGHAVISDTADTVALEIQNGRGETLTVTGVTVSAGDCTTTTVPAVDPFLPILAGEAQVVTLGGCTTLGSAGESYKADITISYTAGGTLPLTSTGTIAEKVTA